VGEKLATHIHLMPRLRIHGALQPLPGVSSWHVVLLRDGTTLPRRFDDSRNVDILICPYSGGCMLNCVITYKYCHRRNLMTMLEQNRPWLLGVKSEVSLKRRGGGGNRF
jgi:hypothetical protein